MPRTGDNREEENRKCSRQWYQEHKEQKTAYVLKWTHEHRDKVNKTTRRHKQKVKLEVITYYGDGKCACVKCGFSDIRALSIDHINGGGSLHREFIHAKSYYHWLRKNNYPSGYQTLCMNCQFIKREENKEYAIMKDCTR